MRPVRGVLLAVLLLTSARAGAGIPHAAIEVEPGKETFSRLYEARALASSDPAVATGEELPSGELLVAGIAQGEADLVALRGGRIVALRVRVRAPGTRLPDPVAERIKALQEGCGDRATYTPGARPKLELRSPTGACRAAAMALTATAHLAHDDVEVEFDSPSLLEQLKEMEAAVTAARLPVKLAYRAAQLELKGTLTRAQAGALVLALYAHSVGGLPVDDSQLTIAEPDAGPPPEPVDAGPAPRAAPAEQLPTVEHGLPPELRDPKPRKGKGAKAH